MSEFRTNKFTVKGDIPAKIYKEFAAQLAEPLTHPFNSSLLQGQYPKVYKHEMSTPVPKLIPCTECSADEKYFRSPNCR